MSTTDVEQRIISLLQEFRHAAREEVLSDLIDGLRGDSWKTRDERRAASNGHGGARLGAGRPKSPDSGVSHLKRANVDLSQPVRVTLYADGSTPDFLGGAVLKILGETLSAGYDRFGCKLLRHKIESKKIVLTVTAQDKRALARGMQGLMVSLARRANKAAKRKGKVWGDRYEVSS